jgi:acyl carrier protein
MALNELDGTRARVSQAVARALRIPPTAIPAVLRMGSTPGWDSLGHMTVVLEIEREFGIRVPTARIADLTDVEAIVRAVSADNGAR